MTASIEVLGAPEASDEALGSHVAHDGGRPRPGQACGRGQCQGCLAQGWLAGCGLVGCTVIGHGLCFLGV
ncbi:hypothetical protein TIFTF001_045534 [Ficus carica]|uniref:Uncharacterized protein n=1 Tax=Ficus carica TaxID=3494 RepID=A0AA88CLW3_FICCA|nr:hypothetical protein TIFTF001_045534 [Ficus carica]